MVFTLAACGGGDGDTNGDNQADAGSKAITLSGKVVDGPIAGANVCLFSGGTQVRSAAGDAICSGQTDAEGNYTLSIPRNLAPGFFTLMAAKGSDIKLASALGTLEQIVAAAGSAGTVTTATLPASTVTHFTTAAFALADKNHDGAVSKDEQDAYVPDISVEQNAAALIKAVIDFGQGGSLIGGQTTDTLALALAAVRNLPFGTSDLTLDQWLADPANADVIAAVKKDVAATLDGKFTKYKLSRTVTASHIPPVVSLDGGSASIYCGIDTENADEVVEIALDAARRAVVVKYTDEEESGEMLGTYDPSTGAVNIEDYYPRQVVQADARVTFYNDGYFKLKGTMDAQGNLAGNFADMSATTWTLDSTRQECTASGSFTATRL